MSPIDDTPGTPARWIGRLETVLTVTFALTVVFTVAAAVLAGLSMFFRPGYGVDLVLPVGGDAFAEALRPGTRVWPGATATVSMTQASPAFAGLYLLTWLPGAVTTLLALGGLVRVLRRGRAGDRSLFSAATVSDLRRIGAVLIIGSLAGAVLSMGAKALLAVMLLRGFALTWPGLPVVLGVVAGLAVLAVAEIVRRGLVMLTDLEGTV